MVTRVTRNECMIMILGATDSTPELDIRRASELANFFRVELPCGSVAKLSADYYTYWPNDEYSPVPTT